MWYNAVQEARRAAADLSRTPEEIRQTLLNGQGCARVLAWLGAWCGVQREHDALVPWSPEVKDRLFRALFACRSAYACMMWTDLFDIPVRLNLPGTEGGTNWRPRMPFTAAQAARLPQSAWIRSVSIASDRA